MKIKLNYTNKSFAIALLMTTHMATTPVFCMDVLPTSETIQTTATQSIVMPECIQDSRIAFDNLSLSDKTIIAKHIECLPQLKVSGNTIKSLSEFLRNCIKNKPQMPFEDLVQQAISTGIPLQCIMLGFPVKSQNVDEVYDERAGLGDLLSLITLRHVAFEIGKVYGPGAKFRIVSDYAALKDIVSPESAGIYQAGIQHLVDLFPGTLEYDRDFHDADFTYTVSDVTLKDKRYSLAGKANAERIMVAKAKSEGFSAYITDSLKDTPHLRFSVHHYKNGESNKLTLPFMGKKLGTPCHHVCLVDAESKSILTKYKTQEGRAVGEMKVMELPTIDGHIIPLTYFKV